MAFEVELVGEAADDYDEIIAWYERQQVGLGMRFYLVMNNVFQKLEFHPFNYSYYFKAYRHTVLKGFPYRVVFKVEKNKVRILAIFHTSRHPKEFRKRLK